MMIKNTFRLFKWTAVRSIKTAEKGSYCKEVLKKTKNIIDITT